MKRERAIDIFRRDGLLALLVASLQYGRNFAIEAYMHQVRPKFPITNETVEYNGVHVRPYRLVDRFVPFTLSLNQGGHEEPEVYEFGLCKSLRENVEAGDSVVVVGGGLGVTMVVAARQAGDNGTVTVYEGAPNMVEHLEITERINDLNTDINIVNGIVSSPYRLQGTSERVKTVDPTEIPECDVLELDCEGAETEILPALNIRPETIIVETHGNLKQVRQQLVSLGYTIKRKEIAETGYYETMCRKKGVFVLTAGA